MVSADHSSSGHAISRRVNDVNAFLFARARTFARLTRGGRLHGSWLPKFGINQRTVRWIISNPLYAITMIRHDITAGCLHR